MTLAKVADSRTYYPEIGELCGVLLRRKERFAKTAVGWILRDISKYDIQFVRQLIENNIKGFTAKSLKNAIRYLGKDIQKQYLDILNRD